MLFKSHSMFITIEFKYQYTGTCKAVMGGRPTISAQAKNLPQSYYQFPLYAILKNRNYTILLQSLIVLRLLYSLVCYLNNRCIKDMTCW